MWRPLAAGKRRVGVHSGSAEGAESGSVCEDTRESGQTRSGATAAACTRARLGAIEPSGVSIEPPR